MCLPAAHSQAVLGGHQGGLLTGCVAVHPPIALLYFEANVAFFLQVARRGTSPPEACRPVVRP